MGIKSSVDEDRFECESENCICDECDNDDCPREPCAWCHSQQFEDDVIACGNYQQQGN